MEEPTRPRFFKVLVVDFARRIEIPQGFLCHFPEGRRRESGTTEVASAKVVLTNAQGNIWPVELEEIDGRVFLTTGWPKFVEDNCLRKGEFLIFKYHGRMHFMVSVFGVNAVEKSGWSSGSGHAQATENAGGGLPCPIIPSRKGGDSGDKLTETPKSLMHSHPQTDTMQRNTQGGGYISSQGTIGFLDLHKVVCSKDYLETYLSQSETMEDDKAKAVTEVMRTLCVDKLTVDLFCAILCLHKWKVEAAAEYFIVCRGKSEILEQSLKQRFVLQFDLVKEQLQCFFPQDYVSERIKKKNIEGPNLSNQPLQHDLKVAPVKRRLVDEYKPCDLSHRQKRIVKLQGNSQTQTPRRSPRLAHENNTCNNKKELRKGRPKVLKTPPDAKCQVKDRAHKSCSLHQKIDNALKAVHEEATGFLSQDTRILDSPRCEVGLSKEHEHDQGDTGNMLDQVNDGENCKEQLGRNAMGNSESIMSTYCVDPLPTNSSLTAYSRINELSFTWKPSQHASSLEKVLLEIQRDNFVNTIAHIQKIIRDDPSDVLSADVIEATVRIEIIKWDLCLQDKEAHNKIVNAMLEYAKKVKGRHNFNIETRKEEFSVKLQDVLKWQLKELELTYTSLESDYKKATADASFFFLTFEEHKKKLNAVKDGIKDLQQSCMTKDDEMQKLAHQVAEHETVYQKSIMEKVRVKMALKSHEKTLGYVKERLASTESGSFDVGALVKVEMDNMSKEIELFKGKLLNINFKKE